MYKAKKLTTITNLKKLKTHISHSYVGAKCEFRCHSIVSKNLLTQFSYYQLFRLYFKTKIIQINHLWHIFVLNSNIVRLK